MKRHNQFSATLTLTSIVLTSLVVLSFGCAKKEEKEIKIGHIAPLTGDAAIWGKWEVEGIDFAVEEINAKRGIDGRKLKIIHEDDKADPKAAVSALEKLITVDKVKLVIGATLSSTTLACAPIAEQNSVVLLSPSAQSPKISQAGDYIFRIFASSEIEGKHLATLADKFHIKSAALLFLNNDYGVGLRDVIRSKLSEQKIPIVSEQAYDAETKDFKTQISKIKAISPEALYLLGYPTDMGTVLRQIKEMGLKTKIFAPNSFEGEEIIKIAKEGAEGVIYVYPVLSDIDAANTVKRRFFEKYKQDMNVYNGMGYDAVYILSLAIEKLIKEKGNVNGEVVKNALYTINLNNA